MIEDDVKTLHNLPKKTYLDYIKLFPITQTRQARDYTTIILTVVAIIIFSVFAITPTVNTILELRKTLADREEANEQLTTKLASLSNLQAEYKNLGTTLERVNTAIPTTPDLPSLFAKIQTLASENGITLAELSSEDVSLETVNRNRQPTAITIFMTIEAPYAQTISFIDALRTFDRILTIDTVTLQKNSETSQSIETIITAKAYFHSEGDASL